MQHRTLHQNVPFPF